jgi:hypothetical protein
MIKRTVRTIVSAYFPIFTIVVTLAKPLKPTGIAVYMQD